MSDLVRRAALLGAALAMGVAGLVVPAPAGAAAVPAAGVPAAAPAAAAASRPAVYVPTMKLPRGTGTGARIVYKRSEPQHVWILDVKGHVIRDFPVTGRSDWPRAGRYRVFSKSPWSTSTHYGVDFQYMVRFAHGNSASIGFHSIPTRNGHPIQSVSSLGQALGLGGCVRSAKPNAVFIYRWAKVGTRVVVL
jgi:hypothetical protein